MSPRELRFCMLFSMARGCRGVGVWDGGRLVLNEVAHGESRPSVACVEMCSVRYNSFHFLFHCPYTAPI